MIALWIRVVYITGAAQSPLFAHLELDARVNDAQAWALAGGENPEPGPYFRAPLYAYFLASVYSVFGHDLIAARLAQALLGAIIAALIGAIALTLWGRRTGILAAILAAVYGPLIYFCGELVSVTLEVALIAGSLALTLRAARSRGGGRGTVAVAGLLLAAAAITRPTVLPFALAAAVWLHARSAGRVAVGIYLVAALSLPLAATLRNGLLAGDWVFIASQGGINFYIGNNPLSDGSTPYVPGAGSGIAATHEEPARIASAAAGRALRPSEVSAYWYRRGAEFWARTPGRALLHYAKKVGLVWNRRELPNNQDQQFFAPFHSWIFRVPWLPGFALLAPIALVAAWTERRTAGLLTAFLAVTTAVTAAFFVCDRFRLPLAVAVIPLAAAGAVRCLAEVAALARRSSWPRALARTIATHRPTAALFAAAAAFVVLPFARLQATETGLSWFRLARAYESAGQARLAAQAYGDAETAGLATPEFYNNFGLLALRQRAPVPAEARFRRALMIDPKYGPAHANLAELYMRAEKWDFAATEYAAAAALIPDRAAELYTNAGMLYANLGRAAEARAVYERALRARPGFGPAVEGLARLATPGAGSAP